MDIPTPHRPRVCDFTVCAVWEPPRFLCQTVSRKWKISMLCVKQTISQGIYTKIQIIHMLEFSYNNQQVALLRKPFSPDNIPCSELAGATVILAVLTVTAKDDT